MTTMEYGVGIHGDGGGAALAELPPVRDSGTGLSEDTVDYLCDCKRDPSWLRAARKEALHRYKAASALPDWAPPELASLDFDSLRYYSAPDMAGRDGAALLEEIGVTQERGETSGAAMAQVDGEVVYNDLLDTWKQQGAVYVDSTTGLRDYGDLFRPYFGSLVGIDENAFTRLNAAVFSGGSFIYVPPRVRLTAPMQCFMHLQAESGSQFGRTLIIVGEGAEVTFFESCTSGGGSHASLHCSVGEFIVGEGARLNYVAFQNWRDNVVNLSILRARLARDASVQWLDCTVGGRLTMKYPCSILDGEGAKSEATMVSIACDRQLHDTGAKMLHRAAHTSSNILSKSICSGGGRAGYRGMVDIPRTVTGCRNNTVCDSMLLDPASRCHTYPAIQAQGPGNTAQHEASVSQVDAEQIFYMAARGISENTARSLIVNGFVDDVVKRFPLRYAMDIRHILDVEMTNSVG